MFKPVSSSKVFPISSLLNLVKAPLVEYLIHWFLYLASLPPPCLSNLTIGGNSISITTKVEKGESPLESADRLVSKEQRIRKSRYYSWVKSINEKTIN